LNHPNAQFANTGACVKDDIVAVVQAYMHAGRVAAILYCSRARCGDRTADPIEGD